MGISFEGVISRGNWRRHEVKFNKAFDYCSEEYMQMFVDLSKGKEICINYKIDRTDGL